MACPPLVAAILGARSSLFLPFKELGLIIADEEHDASYKQQEPAPRYHARDAAIYYASLSGAHVLLGSATPSVESYYNCMQQKYALVQLNERYGQVELPQISVIDIKKVLKNVILDIEDSGWGPNNTFRFPLHGGTGSIFRAIMAIV